MSKLKKTRTNFIFITGGVVSSVGKGITSATLGTLLKACGYSVFLQKFDPYLNIDPGTLNPNEHGEVFVTKDGAETDLDLGHYERFLGEELNQNSNVTLGRIFQSILNKERKGEYLGKTIQYVPHVTDLTIDYLLKSSREDKYDFVITEIGGTVGDLEMAIYLEAIRQLFNSRMKKKLCLIHVGLLIDLATTNETKTKALQHSVIALHQAGLKPNILVARSQDPVEKSLLEKLSLLCGIEYENIFNCFNVNNIYKMPLTYAKTGLTKAIFQEFEMKNVQPKLTEWRKLAISIDNAKTTKKIIIVGKYSNLSDAYLSVYESIKFAGYKFKENFKTQFIDAELITKDNINSLLGKADGILVPGGFGKTAIENKILTIKFARENNIPFLGICLGFQLAVIEYLRNAKNIFDANSTEFDHETTNPVIRLISGKNAKTNLGGTMRLGNFKCEILDNTLASGLYKAKFTDERHRHRYEFNNDYLDIIEDGNARFSGVECVGKIREVFEIKKHPFFIASQYHSEFKSLPGKPHPLFVGFAKAVLKEK